MTLINLLFAVIVFFVLLGAAKILDTYIGHSFWINALILAVLVSLFMMVRRYAGKALFPKCKNGTCGPSDYEGIPVRPGDKGLTFKCRCGQLYLRKRNRFFILGEGGQAIPYKIKRHFYTRWDDDT